MERSVHTFIYRSFDIQHDLAALLCLLKDAEQVDHTGEVVTEASLADQLTWSGQDPALNNWVVTLPDSTTLLAYGVVQKTPNDVNADLHIVVHPSWRRQGIGNQLFVHLLGRIRELDAQAVRVYADVHNEGARLFVSAHGFEAISAYTRLSVPSLHTFPDAILPQGFIVRSYNQIRRPDLYTEVMNRGYEGLWGHLQSTQEEISEWLSRLNHSGIFLLIAPDGTVAGICRADISEHLTTERGVSTALIDAPGIIPEYRDANLFLPLLLIAIHWLRPQGPAMLELESWGDAPDTLAIYRNLGFQVMKEEISYCLDLL